MPKLYDQVPEEAEDTENNKYPEELPPVFCLYFGLDEVWHFGVGFPGLGGQPWEASRARISLQKRILLVPSFPQPCFKLLRVVQRHLIDAETAPIEVDRLGRLALEICAGQAEKFFAVSATAVGQRKYMSEP